MRHLILLGHTIAILLIQPANGHCLEKYKLYKKRSLLALPHTISTSSELVITGTAISSGAGAYGLSISDLDRSTAGLIYGAAFYYEAEAKFEDLYARIKNHHGRSLALGLIEAANLGLGEDLYEYLDDLNEKYFNHNPISINTLIKLLNDGNKNNLFCPVERFVFTKEQISKYIVDYLTPTSYSL